MELNWKQEERFYAKVEQGAYKVNPDGMGNYSAVLLVMDETGTPMQTVLGEGSFASADAAKLACEKDNKEKTDKP
jgi:hypothetical protein